MWKEQKEEDDVEGIGRSGENRKEWREQKGVDGVEERNRKEYKGRSRGERHTRSNVKKWNERIREKKYTGQNRKEWRAKEQVEGKEWRQGQGREVVDREENGAIHNSEQRMKGK